MMNDIKKRGRYNYRLPVVSPVEFEVKEVPIDPYLLGLLLGDGGIKKQVTLTTQALLITGDILPRLPSSTLRSNGNEPCNDRAIQMESKGTEGRFSYSSYLDSQQNKGT